MQNENEDQILASREYNKLDKKLDKRIKSLSIETLEDIGYASVMEASNRLRRKRIKVHSKPIKFTGYLRFGNEQFYAMKSDDSDMVIFNVKGGQHSVIKIPMDSRDRRRFMYHIAKMMGFKIFDRKFGFDIYIPSSAYGKKDSCIIHVGKK